MLVSDLEKVFEDSVYYNLHVEERNLSCKDSIFSERHFSTNRYGDNFIDNEKYGEDEVIWCDIERNGKRNVLNVGIIHYINEEEEQC